MTSKTSPGPELPWDQAVVDIPKSGVAATRSASADELERVAASLDLAACRALDADYRIEPLSGGRFQLTGHLRAEITQTCVVTLDPLESTIEEDFAAVFWPEADLPAPESGELALDEEPEREAIAGGQIGVGRIVFETLAAAIEPFPRKPDAVLDWQPPGPAQSSRSEADSPFSVLANLKTKT